MESIAALLVVKIEASNYAALSGELKSVVVVHTEYASLPCLTYFPCYLGKA